MYYSLTLLLLAFSVRGMIKLVGPEETTEDITKPISKEQEISFYRFKTYFDDGNKQWSVFDIARKYYINKDSNITFQNFIQAGKEYLITQMADSRMSFQAIGKKITKIQPALAYYMNEKKNMTFSLEEFFRHSVQGQFKQFLNVFISYNELPWEIQQQKIHELEAKKKRHGADHPHMKHELETEERMVSGHRHEHTVTVDKLRQNEVRMRYQNEYNGIEWLPDGRRVIDEDYDSLTPSRERNLHKYANKRDQITKEEVDELIDFEMDL